MNRISQYVSAALVKTGCAKSARSRRKSEIRRIALIPVAPPPRLYAENKTLPLLAPPALIVQSIDNNRQSDAFDRKMNATRQAMGAKLTAALLEELKAQCFAPALLQNVNRSATDLNEVDYRSLHTRDAVLHVGFSRVGMSSSRWSNGYEPQVNAWALLKARPAALDRLAEGYVYYGADSGGQSSVWNVPADSRYCYATFEDLIAKVEEVSAGYDAAIRVIALRIAEQLRKQL